MFRDLLIFIVWVLIGFFGVAFIIGAAEGRTLKLDEARLIKIEGGIRNLTSQTTQLDKLSKASSRDIDIIIDSNGGEVTTGLAFVNAMIRAKERGADLHCIVTGMAASMAFIILSECTDRYAYKYSMLLWHGVRVSSGFGGFTVEQMKYLVSVLRGWESPVNAKVIKELDISEEVYYYNYQHETLWLAVQLLELSPKFLTIVEDMEISKATKHIIRGGR